MIADFDPVRVLLQYVCLLFSLCVHEAAHAAMAYRCGDPSAKFLGRMTLNPLAHIDPIGTVVMPLLMFITNVPFLIGWAKPVPVNPRNLRNMRRDQVLVSLAGPGSNLIVAFLMAVILRLLHVLMHGGVVGFDTIDPLVMALSYLLVVNLGLFVFNLIPIPPLDGSWVLHYFLPPSGQRMLEQIGPFGIVLVLFLGRHIVGVPLGLLLNAVDWFVNW